MLPPRGFGAEVTKAPLFFMPKSFGSTNPLPQMSIADALRFEFEWQREHEHLIIPQSSPANCKDLSIDPDLARADGTDFTLVRKY